MSHTPSMNRKIPGIPENSKIRSIPPIPEKASISKVKYFSTCVKERMEKDIEGY